MAVYKVMRIFRDRPRKVTIYDRLTLEEARQICADDESSSISCKGSVGKARTRKYGPWFDAYEEY